MMRFWKRTGILALALFLAGTAEAFAQMPSNELEGTWRLVKQERVYPDSTVDYSDQWGPGYKILNSTHFAWGRETKDGEEVLAGGGRYEYHPDKDIYVEHIEYHSDPGFAGQTIQFTARVEGDTWYHIGDVGRYKLREVWKRVDPKEAAQQTRRESKVVTTSAGEGSGEADAQDSDAQEK
jgi:hypothetical protein